MSSRPSVEEPDQKPSLEAFSSCARLAISPAIFRTQACSTMPPDPDNGSEDRMGAGIR